MRLTEAFDDFHENIKLSSLSEERINSAWGRLHALLTDKFGVAPENVYIQGSYANDTAVKPADDDGEYDLDIVSVHVGAGTTAAEAIEELTAVLSQDGDLKKRLEPNESGRPCVRLRYADDTEGFGFHIDIVPARGDDAKGVIEVPMRGQDDWRESAPYEYTAWCQEQGEPFLRIVRFLKRWRDEHGDGSIASIVLQVLTAECLDRATSDAEAVTGTLQNMKDFLGRSPDSAPDLFNPVLDSENLSDRWEDKDYVKFRAELSEAVNLADEALREPGQQESHDAWAKLFGKDFPATPTDVTSESAAVPPPPPDYRSQRQQAPQDERYG
ncbi:MAG: nucleotidyltransferase [Solirubrobacteraceae bacterium]